jgi:uncharacterized protein YjbJ (UPF0337 family)
MRPWYSCSLYRIDQFYSQDVLERTWFRDALIRSGSALQRSNNQMSGHDGHRTIRDLEQYIDEVVALHTQQTNNEEMAMDKDRIKGSAEQAKGAVKETAGKVFGDKRLETEGKADKAAGKVQNAIGGLKDAVRGK